MPDKGTPAEEIFGHVVEAARALGVNEIEAIIGSDYEALTRFANNGIHQNVAERTTLLSVRPLIDGRTARASTNRLDREAIRRVVEQSVALARLMEPDADLLPLAGPADCAGIAPAVSPDFAPGFAAGLAPGFAPGPARHFKATAQATPEERARTVAAAIGVVESAGQTAAGIFSTGESVFALFNSHGVACHYAETMARFSITAMAGGSSGWAKASACNLADLDPLQLAQTAARKAADSGDPRELPPDRYTVILEPAAVLDLVGQMFGDFSATAIRDGRSFLNDRIGHKLFGENITIHDDALHPGQSGAPFDGEGVPRRRLTLVERGVVREVAYSRSAAALEGVAPTGHGLALPNEYGEAPANIVIAGGAPSVDDMVASTERGILVTRLWYIREVDPYDKIFTGMTRDGTFLVEAGRVTGGVRNFRFNVGLMEMLSNVEAIGPTVRSSGEETFDMVAPAMKVRGFNFTEVTRF